MAGPLLNIILSTLALVSIAGIISSFTRPDAAAAVSPALLALAVAASALFDMRFGALFFIAAFIALLPGLFSGAAPGGWLPRLHLLLNGLLGAGAVALIGMRRDYLDSRHSYDLRSLVEKEGEKNLIIGEIEAEKGKRRGLEERLRGIGRLAAAIQDLQKAALSDDLPIRAAEAIHDVIPSGRVLLYSPGDIGRPIAVFPPAPEGNLSGEDYATIVVESRRPLLIRDMERESLHLPSGVPPRAVMSLIAAPITTRKGTGMIRVESDRAGTFELEDLRSLVSLSVPIGNAIENADLYEETERLARFDALTGLLRKWRWNEEFGREFDRARRYNLSLSLILIDFDHFKGLNDTFGHIAGDAALRDGSSIILDSAPKGAVAGRVGGEEIAVLMPSLAVDEAHAAAERIRLAVSGIKRPDGTDLTVSIGLAGMEGSSSPSELFETADKALYEAKASGRNRVVLAS